MAATTIARPDATEYAPFYAGYVGLVPEPGDVLALLAAEDRDTLAMLRGLGERDAAFRYADGKWSIKQVVGHIADAERIFVYRALAFARGERQSLPGFDENAYVDAARFDARTLADLLDEHRRVRAATLAFFGALDADELARRGVANGKAISVRAIAYITAGHERHHVRVLRDRYGAVLGGR